MRIRSSLIIAAALGATLFASGRTRTPGRVDIRQLMTAAEFENCGLAKLSDNDIQNLNAWLTEFLAKEAVESQQGAPGDGGEPGASFEDLEGAVILADDGQFLGKITTNSIDPRSLLNEIGPYGSEISSTSIFNSISRYGSEISGLSPFNPIASTPPRVFKGNKFMGFLTVDKLKTPRIDPYALIAWLKSQE